MSKVMKLVIAAVMGLIAMLLAISYVSREIDAVVGKVGASDVVAAKQDIPAHVMIKQEMLQRLPNVPKSFQQPDSVAWTLYEEKKEILVGKFTIAGLKRGEQVMLSKTTSGEATPLAAMLKAGRQGVSVRVVGQAPGLHGLLNPEDYVDVFASFEFEKSKDEKITEVRNLLQDIRVLAVNGATDTTSKIRSAGGNTDDPRQVEIKVQTITLDLPVDAIQKMFLAQQLGDVYLSLRAPGDHQQYTYEIMNDQRLVTSQYRLLRSVTNPMDSFRQAMEQQRR